MQRSKFVIQPFKHNQQMDEDYANRTWQTLHDAIRCVTLLVFLARSRTVPQILFAACWSVEVGLKLGSFAA